MQHAWNGQLPQYICKQPCSSAKAAKAVKSTSLERLQPLIDHPHQ